MCNRWGKRPEKSIPILFFKKKPHQTPNCGLKIYNKPLKFASETRYPGVTIDSQLSWQPHINKVIDKAGTTLRYLGARMRSIHGPKPKLMKLVFTGIARTQIPFGTIVWIQTARSKKNRRALERINRQACMMVTPTTRSTPQASLEVMYNIMPLQLYLEEAGCHGLS